MKGGHKTLDCRAAYWTVQLPLNSNSLTCVLLFEQSSIVRVFEKPIPDRDLIYTIDLTLC